MTERETGFSFSTLVESASACNAGRRACREMLERANSSLKYCELINNICTIMPLMMAAHWLYLLLNEDTEE
jgi:hypothetical protein